MKAKNADVEQMESICYLCKRQEDNLSTVKIPLSQGGMIDVHPSCLDFYMTQQFQTAASCGGCSGDAGCCG
jgi:hypothetical protein